MARKNPEPQYSVDIQGRTTLINLKGSVEDRQWMESTCRKTMILASKIGPTALKDWARRQAPASSLAGRRGLIIWISNSNVQRAGPSTRQTGSSPAIACTAQNAGK